MKSSVMFALDESPCSMGALNWLFTSLLKDKDHLSVVACVDKDEEVDKMMHHCKTLVRAVWDAHAVDVDMSVQILLGKPGKAICEAVDSQKPDLLVLGSAGKNNIKGLLVGSVSSYCVANANTAVIVCRVPVKDDDGKVLAPQNLKKEWRGFVDHVGGETSEY
ncbi:MAG: hypothetical protein SGCHY_001192 [Lobulomycetales sp.]